ncbi:hypothetical protein Tco_0949141, partial [Tanacetum coccineum]
AQALTIIKELSKNYVQSNVIQVHPTTTTSTETTSSADLQHQLYLKMKRSLQDRANDPALWESNKDSATYVSKQQQQEWDAWVEETIVNEDEHGNTEENKYILSLYKIHTKRFLEVDLEEKMNHWVRKEFKNFNEEARLSIQHWKDSWHKEITTGQLYSLDYIEQIIVMREDDKSDSFFEADFKSRVIWERVHDFQLGIDSYQIKVNLTAPTLTFLEIEEHELYSIIDNPSTGLIYLNSKDEKRVMYLMEIVKFCDATLEKVLKKGKAQDLPI